MGTGISNWHIWNFEPTKIRVFLLFQIATRLYSQHNYMKQIQNPLWNVNFFMENGISY